MNYTTTLSDILQHCIDGDADLVKLLDARDPETRSSLMHYACDKGSASLVEL